jgi:hypothetical protein
MAQTPGTIQGHIMGLYVGANRIAAMKGVNLDLGVAMLDMNNADTGDYDTVKPARRNWSASGNGHFQFDAGYGVKDLFDAWKAGTLLVCKFSTYVTLDIDFTGSGYIESLKASFPDHENSTYDFSIKGATDAARATH